MTLPLSCVYLITDGTAGRQDFFARIEAALEGGVRFLQLREKALDGRTLLKTARELRGLTRQYGAFLIINDRADIALLSEADGVHLGQASMPPEDVRKIVGPSMLIGVSAHSLKEAKEAYEGGADFITTGPVFFTPSKAGYGEPVGPGLLREVKAAMPIPVYAVGGVKKENLAELIENRADGVAAISAILSGPDVKKNAAGFLEAFLKAKT